MQNWGYGNNENGCSDRSDHAGLELNCKIVEHLACFEMNDNNSSKTIDELGDFSEISCSDQSFNYMETFQEILPSRSPQSDSPETDEVFDNESLFSDSSFSTSSDNDYIPEDLFFDAVDDDKLDGSEEILTVSPQYFTFTFMFFNQNSESSISISCLSKSEK